MTSELPLDRPLDDAARRVLREELTDAARWLRDAADPDEAVHEARKALKRARALLRLVRSGMDGDVRKAANTRLRDIGRRLSDLRDAAVLVQTLDALCERHADALSPGLYDGLRAVLTTEHEVQRARLAAGGDGMPAGADLPAVLEEVAAEVEHWRIDDEAVVVRDGLRRTAKRGAKRLDDVRDAASPTALHELRKRVKDLRYHVEVLTPAWPAALEPSADVLHELTDLLGDDHDLHVLRDAVAAVDEGEVSTVDRRLLLDLVDADRRRLQAVAIPLAQRVYTERPKAFARRLTAYLTLARQEAGASG